MNAATRTTVASALRVRLGGATQRLGFYIIPSALGLPHARRRHRGCGIPDRRRSVTARRKVRVDRACGLGVRVARVDARPACTRRRSMRSTTRARRCIVAWCACVLTGVLGWLAAAQAAPDAARRREVGRRGTHGDCRDGGLGRVRAAASRALQSARQVLAAGTRASRAAGCGRSAACRGGCGDRSANALLLQPVPLALLAVPANAMTYLAVTSWWDIPEAAVLVGRIRTVLTRGVRGL